MVIAIRDSEEGRRHRKCVSAGVACSQSLQTDGSLLGSVDGIKHSRSSLFIEVLTNGNCHSSTISESNRSPVAFARASL